MLQRRKQLSFLLKFAFHRLHRERGNMARFVALGAVIGVISAMWALNREVTEGPQRYLSSLSVNYWVTQVGADSLATNSYVEPALLEQLESNGYQADGLLVYFGKIDARDGVIQSYTPGSVLDPQLVVGRQVQASNETVLDHLLARDLGVHLGSTVTMVGRSYSVVGLSRETNSLGKQLAFINQDAMTRIVGQPTYQALAVRLAAGQSWPPAGMSLAGYSVATQQHFIETNRLYWVNAVTGFFTLIMVVAFLLLVGLMVLLLKLAFNQSRPMLSRMRTTGATRGYLVGVETVMMLVLIVPATVVAAAVALVILMLANAALPGVSASLVATDVLVALAIAVVVTVLAEIRPLWRLAHLTPIEAIRQL